MATSRVSERPFYYTRAGLERLRIRIVAVREEYLAVCRTNEEAAGAGDNSVWHDNFAYEENQRRMHQLAARVTELERLAARAQVVPREEIRSDRVSVGSRVVLRVSGEERVVSWLIAGFDDGDPSHGRISYGSPLGAALMCAEEGDVVRAVIDGRSRDFEIVEILLPDASEV